MGKKIQIKITEWDGGITRDLRVQSTNKFKLSTNFDNYSDKKRLIPLNALISNETKNLDIVQFIQTNEQIYGLGVVVGGAIAKVYKKTGDIVSGGWVEDQSVEGSGARNENIFFEYKNFLYGWEAGARIWRHGDITGIATNETFQTIAYTNVAQPVHHPADDNAYFFADNKVYRLDNTSWDGVVLTLPDNLIITCATDYGNYLAIGCKPKNGVGNSIVYLWDRDSSLETVSDKIDWGKGELVILAVINDTLIGISNVSTSSSFSIKPKIHIKGYSGSLIFIQELDVDSTTTGDEDYKVPNSAIGRTQNDKLYFPVVAFSGTGDNYTGIFVVGRHDLGSPFSITLAYKITSSASNPIQGFNIFEDYLWVAHSDDGSVDRTNASAFATATYESYIITGGDSSINKKLLRATVMTEKQPSAGTTKLEYKVNDGSFITLFTNTDDDDIRKTVLKQADGSNLKQFKEIQFKITSTGGTVILGLKFSYEEISDDK